MSADNIATELAAFVTDHFTDGTLSVRPPPLNCAPHACALAGWALQALALSRRLADATNQRFSVHVFSPCVGGLKSLPPPPPTSRTSLSLHSAHDAELTRLVKALGARELVNLKAPLLKWDIFSRTAARVAVFVDLDSSCCRTSPFRRRRRRPALGGGPRRRRGPRGRSATRRGVRSSGLRLARADRVRGQRRKELLTYLDFSSPSTRDAARATATARRPRPPARPSTATWAGARAVAPADAWRQRHLQMLERNDWRSSAPTSTRASSST